MGAIGNLVSLATLAAAINNLPLAIHNLPPHLVPAGLHPSTEVPTLLGVACHRLRGAVVVWPSSSNPQDCGVDRCRRSTPTQTWMAAYRRAPIALVACQASP